jgi:3-deoxy-D-manno-octulosonic-acid transferase
MSNGKPRRSAPRNDDESRHESRQVVAIRTLTEGASAIHEGREKQIQKPKRAHLHQETGHAVLRNPRHMEILEENEEEEACSMTAIKIGEG